MTPTPAPTLPPLEMMRPMLAQVTGTTATAGYAQVKLSWDTVSDAESYSIYKADTEAELASAQALATSVTETSYLDAGLSAGDRPWYRVDAVAEGNTQEGTPFQADMATGLAALKANAVISYAFTGEDRLFDGTKSVDKTEDLDEIIGLTQGSIVIKARYGGPSDPTKTVRTLLGIGNSDSLNTRSFFLGTRADGNHALRYEMCTGLYSSAATATQYTDQKWHTFVLTAKPSYVNVTMDGVSGASGADGRYTDAKYDGFFTRTQNADSLTIGGMSGIPSNTNGNTYENWMGEIAYVIITDEVLEEAQAQALTLAEKPADVTINLSKLTTEPAAGSTVGTVTLTGADVNGGVPVLAPGQGDNSKFELDGTTLKTKEALAPFTNYIVVLSSSVGNAEPVRFTVRTLGDLSTPLVSQKTKLSLPQEDGTYPAFPDQVANFAGLDDLTIKVQFMQKASALSSLFSVSNGTMAANHLHLYANGPTLGYEIRGITGSADIKGAASGLRPAGLNTVAFVADSSAHTLKLFINGALANTQTLTEPTYYFLKDIAGLDTVEIGRTSRNGNTYPFTGDIIDLEVYGKALTDDEMIAYTSGTPAEVPMPMPGTPDASTQPFTAGDESGSDYFRIPALLTLKNGDVMAAIDARFGNTTDSPNNLDTAVRFLRSGSSTWETVQLPNHFIDFSDAGGYKGNSASFIDPCIVQTDTGRLIMVVDAFPYGAGYGPSVNGSGMVTINGKQYVALTDGDYTNMSSFKYYIGDDRAVYTIADSTKTVYSVDAEYNLYRNGAPLTVTQQGTNANGTVPMSVFYADAVLRPLKTSFLWLRTSDDMGVTWSAPQILNAAKAENERFLGVGPGRGHVVQSGAHQGRILIPLYDNNDGERVSILYSDDNGVTWSRGGRTPMASTNSPGKSSESQLIELPDGTLRLFARGSTGLIGCTDSFDGGVTWEPMVQDPGLAYCGNCMISVINYSKLVDGKPALILSCPEGSGRSNGIIRVGLIDEHPGVVGMGKYTINWKYRLPIQGGEFVYSCLTELSNGDVGILYEHQTNSATPGDNPRYFTYTMDELTAHAVSSSMTIDGTPAPGQTLTVTLKLSSPVIPLLSQVESSLLSVHYPDSSLEDGQLAYSSISSDNLSIAYTGTLPQSPDPGYGYFYEVNIPENFPVADMYGWITAAKAGTAGGTAGTNVRYGITAVPTGNGTFTLSGLRAAQGETVTITVMPGEGQMLTPGSLSAHAGANQLVLTKTGENTYTFVMPSAPVRVSGSFMAYIAEGGAATPGYAQVQLQWGPNENPAATYTVLRGNTQDSQAEKLAEGLTIFTYTDANAGTGTRPWYRVDAVVNGNTTMGDPFQANMPTGLEAMKQNALVYQTFTGADQTFDGSRVVDLTDKLAELTALKTGTVMVQFRYGGPTGTPGATDNGGPYRLLFGVGIQNAADARDLGFYGVKEHNGEIRYNLAGGLTTNANNGVAVADGQWHTALLMDGSSLAFSALDGSTAGGGTYTDPKWDGFLSRMVNPVSVGIGGIPSGHPTAHGNWIGDISYVLITDEPLTLAQGQTITRMEQDAFPVFTLRGSAVTAGVANAIVGEITVEGAGTGATVPTLTAPSAENNNDMFALQGNKLVTAAGLTSGNTYTVEVSGTAATGAFSTKFTVNTLNGERPFYRNDGSGSNNFRIPALLTLQNGDIMAAIDARFGGNSDSANNLDTAVNFKRAGSNHWGLTTLPNNFLDFPNSNSGRQLDSTSFIDPAIVQDTIGNHAGRVYMLVDAFPYNGGIQGGVCQEGTGTVQVDGVSYLALTNADRTAGLNTFAYYLKPNPGGGANAQYQVLAQADDTPTGYTTDDHFNLYHNGVAQTILQGATGEPVAMNLFFKDAVYQVFPTSYLWLIHSDDNGHTWSAPQIIGNDQRTMGDGKFLGVGPGRGHEVQAGPYAGRILFPLYDHGGNMGERARVVYSDDGVNWTLGAQTTMAAANSPGKSSEAQVVELPDGTLRMYARSQTNCIGYTDSTDGGATWAPMVQDLNLPYGGAGNGCQISVINYSEKIDGKPALILSSPYIPGGGSPNRVNGAIRIGLIEEHPGKTGMERYTVNWKYRYSVNGPEGSIVPGLPNVPFAYSCLTELPDGSIAVLYEEDLGSSTIGETIPYKTFSLDELTRSRLSSFTTDKGTYAPGDTITVTMQVSEAVTAADSNWNSGLSIQYSNDLPAGTLSCSGLEADGRTLKFAGTLPTSDRGYRFLITPTDALKLRVANGYLHFGPADVLIGATGDVSIFPSPPANVTVTEVQPTSARLIWDASADSVGVIDYQVYLNDALYTTVTATSLALDGLSKGTSYTVRIEAVDVVGGLSTPVTVRFNTPTAMAALSGTVTAFDGTATSGITVMLQQGTQALTAVTNQNGLYQFASVPVGSYMLVLNVSGGYVVTQFVTLNADKILDIKLPDGKLGTTVTVPSDSGPIPPVLADGLMALFDEADRALVKEDSANQVTFDLSISSAENAEEVDALEKEIGDKKIATILDITLSKTTTLGQSPPRTEPISEAAQLLRLTTLLDEAWKGKNFFVYRYHDGKVDTLTGSPNARGEYFTVNGSELVLYVRNFSSYALAYTEPTPPPPDPSPTPDSGGSGSSNLGGSASSRYLVQVNIKGEGTVSPTSATVRRGERQTFTLRPNPGNILLQLLLDGATIKLPTPNAEGVSSYTLTNVTTNHILDAVFGPANKDVLAAYSDLDGHWARESIRYVVENEIMEGTGNGIFSPDLGASRAMVVTTMYRIAGVPAIREGGPFADVPSGAWYADAVAWASAEGIALGVGGNFFAPDRGVTRQELAALFARYAALTDLDTSADGALLATFADWGDIASWSQDAMAWCVKAGILKGDQNGRLTPTSPATRGELSAMLQRLLEYLAA